MNIPNNDSPVSRRTALAGIGAGGLGLAAATTARSVAAQDTATHPIVGLWTGVKAPGDPPGLNAFNTFHADGTLTSVHSFAGAGVGAWESTGERTANWIIKYLNIADAPGEFVAGTVTVWSALTVDADGNSHTEEAVIELKATDGTVVALFPFSATHVRVVMGPPPLGTPEAGTPIS
jgi:hypothetical protein